MKWEDNHSTAGVKLQQEFGDVLSNSGFDEKSEYGLIKLTMWHWLVQRGGIDESGWGNQVAIVNSTWFGKNSCIRLIY